MPRHPPARLWGLELLAFWFGQGGIKRRSQAEARSVSWEVKGYQQRGRGPSGFLSPPWLAEVWESCSLWISCSVTTPIPRNHSDGKPDSWRPASALCRFSRHHLYGVPSSCSCCLAFYGCYIQNTSGHQEKEPRARGKVGRGPSGCFFSGSMTCIRMCAWGHVHVHTCPCDFFQGPWQVHELHLTGEDGTVW